MLPQKIFEKTCYKIKSGAFWAQNYYAKDMLWKSAVRALLAHKNSFFPVCESSFYKAGLGLLLCFDDQLAYTSNKRLHLLTDIVVKPIIFHTPICLKYLPSPFPPDLHLGNLKDFGQFGDRNWRGMEVEGVVISF